MKMNDTCVWTECVKMVSSGCMSVWVPSCTPEYTWKEEGDFCPFCGEPKEFIPLPKIQKIFGIKGEDEGWRIGTTFSVRIDDE